MILRCLTALLLLLLPVAAHAEWMRATSQHFVVYSNDRPEAVRAYATNLERYDKAMRTFRNLPDPPVPLSARVTVYVLDNIADVQRLSGPNVWGFYIPRPAESVAFVPKRAGSQGYVNFDAQVILLHEYAHHFMYVNAPNASFPAWFTEGWAEFNSTARFDPDGSIAFGEPPRARANMVLKGNALPIRKLLFAPRDSLSGEEWLGMYARGWLLVHYLTLGGKRDGQLTAYLIALNQGKSPEEAAKVFGDLDALDRELGRYKLGTLRVAELNPAALAIEPVAVEPLNAAEAAMMDVRVRVARGVRDKDAAGVYADAQRAAASYPNDPVAQLLLAETALSAKDYAAVDAAADRAVAADPKSVEAYLVKARAKMAVAVAAGDQSKESWNAIRRLIGIANRTDPDDPEPLIAYFESYALARQPPTPVSRQGLYKAFELAPQVPFVRLKAAESYLFEGKPEAARTLLLPLVNSPHGGAYAKQAAALIARIDGKPAPADDGKTGDGGD
ncbi:hypothetical protein [Sphingomonas sp.]|uniref:hypothetical protein n=1 Tax=Sphingomonas sp. TaxID=28214 RepID=UPI001B0E91B7|nr:hypothetical protein [Sphingomonas sp.]MBO9713212.1 hypothetical protein [Sphingomonas sp.]